jgi:hypothetical protein
VRTARDLAAALAGSENRQLLQRALDAGPVEIRARGVSMRPLLQTGDRVRLERLSPRRGHVALVELPDRVILHRLVRRRGTRWLVRGDARSCDDGWVAEHQILAIATARRREAGSPLDSRWTRLDRGSARLLGLVAAPIARLARRCACRSTLAAQRY